MAKLGDAIESLISYLERPTSRGRVAMLLYPPPIERKVLKQFDDILARLCGVGVNSHVINVNAIVNACLETRLEDIVEAWDEQPNEARLAISEPSRERLLKETISTGSDADAVIWMRVGGAYPFLSIAASAERCIGKLQATLVIFYPGSLEGKTTFRLLDRRDGYQYRLDHLEIIDA